MITTDELLKLNGKNGRRLWCGNCPHWKADFIEDGKNCGWSGNCSNPKTLFPKKDADDWCAFHPGFADETEVKA